jgi:hypothetical protein
MKITQELLNNYASKVYQRYYLEASDLALRPGEWPNELQTDVGNGRPFLKMRMLQDGGFIYRQQFGQIQLNIIND